ncbi:1-aminocyclopropane-1-carboxylate deaminase/D-cysteine desulfhydrase [Vibrio sp. SCSIO 43137]|uniref:1-aminocyclopropane-1-carboxylate deaminase/D-cysteine desulfhydrase n=1 Tax=Vibrio sp. SCSIO 43137 TaxID=3021011 RepID=UPI002307F1D1|nr:1-aminocyclopropane-1-carboxylate deaminase/D-cysteine desulfhydrase [Vibrio sp. SCSIO 43137]WCE32655.1 1-aminocyclopropane-1-carboxylate deaminase/D-cysteine desulfhydrase [Vibrio sp. SCSIO 43137]
MKIANSPVTRHTFNNVSFFLKRDDQLHPQFAGNKARKLMSLLTGDFPAIKHVIGHGSAQANSLYSLAALCSLRGWKLTFYVDHIAGYLKQNPAGNYLGALELGANIIDLSEQENRQGLHAKEYIARNHPPQEDTLLVPEGGWYSLAEQGVKQLADEILEWQSTLNRHESEIDIKEKQALTIALPSGTGTTALYLQKHLADAGIEVLTCACVADKAYLTQQFNELDSEAAKPTILSTTSGSDNKHHFGKLYRQEYQIWQDLMQQTGVEFELLYDPYMWLCLQEWLPQNRDKTLLYIHQGGVLGNPSMQNRYRRKFKD